MTEQGAVMKDGMKVLGACSKHQPSTYHSKPVTHAMEDPDQQHEGLILG